MSNWTSKFRSDESGAVTIDWVVLCAAAVALAVAAVTSVETGADDLAGGIWGYVASLGWFS